MYKKINIVFLTFIFISNYANSVNVLAKPTSMCSVIARVVESSDPRFHPGDGLCSGDTTVFSGKVVIACAKTTVAAFETTSATEASRCLTSQAQISNGRGTESGQPLLVSPVGSNLSQQPMSLSWLSVKDAEYYKVTLVGAIHFHQWKGTVQTTKIVLPKLNLESTTQVLIEAISKNKVISYSQTTFNFIDSKKIEQINSSLKLIKNYQVSNVEKSYLTVSLYKRYGLLQDSVNYVSGEIKINPENAALKSLLVALQEEIDLREISSSLNIII